MVVVLIKLSNVFLATVRHLSIFCGVYSVLITLLYLHRPIDVLICDVLSLLVIKKLHAANKSWTAVMPLDQLKVC